MCELPIKPAVSGEFKESTRSRIPLLKTLFWVLALLVLFNSTLLAQQETKPKNVLVLASYRPTSPVSYQWEQGIRSVLKAEFSGRIKTHIEYPGLNFEDDRYNQMLRDLYLYKYSRLKPQLIIALYNGAFDFLLRYGANLFSGIPIVFAGVERQFIQNRTLGENITGVLAGNTYKETLDLALNLHPDTDYCAVVAGAGMIGREWVKTARKAFRLYEDRIDFTYLTGLPMEDLLKKVANLPAHTLVMYLPLLEDGAGKKFEAPESLRQISRVSNAPVYGFWDVLLGHGIVGGYLNSFEEQGKMVAQLGVRILNGEKPADIPIIQAPKFQNMFDWRQIKRWSISESSLPPGSIVKFKELTLWEEHKGQIIGAISLIIFQTLIILLLLHQHRIRRRAEQALDERLQFERLIAEVSSEFSNLAADKVDRKINDALSRIGTHMNVERSFLFRFNWEKTEFRISHLWEAEGIRQDQVVRGVLVRELFPWLADNLPGGKDIVIPDVEELSDVEQARKEYEYCRHIGIQSFLILPIQVADSRLCAIGLDSIRSKKKWAQEDINRLRILGEVFANTIARSHAEEKIKAGELKYRTVADFTYDWEYWANVDGKLEYISPSCERISGYSLEDFMDNPALIREIIVPEDIESWDEHYCASENELKPREIQLRIQRRDGETRWIEHVCQPVFDRQGNNQGVRASNRDITKREFYRSETHKLQSELAHMDRVVTISTLTSALAHEINQPLAAMRSYAQAALRFMDKDQPEYDSVREALQGIVADNKRAAEVVNRLRDLVKKGSTHWQTIEINSIIKDVTGLINSELVLRNASIILDLHPSVPVVQGDSIQIQQVLINLLTNALDAMDDQPIDTRTIAISTRPEDSNEIFVSISDSGGGIPLDTIEAIFSPFHTTKSTGMGLGLSICKSIIEAHGGKIWAENKPGGGAIFSFILAVDSK